MKRLFSIMMLAVVATVAFAFTTPKKAAFSHTYALIEGVWEETEGEGCGQTGTACQFTSSLALAPADFPAAVSAIGTSTSNTSAAVTAGTTTITAVFLRQ